MEATAALIIILVLLAVVAVSIAHRIDDENFDHFLSDFRDFQQQHRR